MKRKGRALSGSESALFCFPGSIEQYASHADLWVSYHAGNLGAFRERVGETYI